MLTCTGSEANDLAMQLARMVSGNNGAVVLENAYHGNTTLIAQMSTCMGSADSRPDFLEAIEPPNTYRGPFAPFRGSVMKSWAISMQGLLIMRLKN